MTYTPADFETMTGEQLDAVRAGFAAGWAAAIEAAARMVAFREPVTAKRIRRIPMPSDNWADLSEIAFRQSTETPQ